MHATPQPPSTEQPSSGFHRGPQEIGALQLFLTFTRISVTGFGSPLFWTHHVLVQRKHWLTEMEFVQAMALAQLLPGPNNCNFAVMVGYRFAGYRGVAAAMAGFIGWPFLILIGVGMLYQRYGGLHLVQQALSGMSAAAAGLLLATGVRMATALPRHWRNWVFCLLAFAGVGMLRWPLMGVVGALVPLAVALAWREMR